jgi:hypothetical protein
VKEPSDDERLAALLDGRVDERRRAELLKHLATSDEDYEVFRDTALILRRLEEGAPAVDPDPPLVTPLPVRRPVPGWYAPARWVALAAVLAALLLGGARLWRERAVAIAGDPVRLAARSNGREGLPEGWTPWAAGSRGDVVPARPTEEERAAYAARAGAQLVGLAVAVRARDTANIHFLAEQAWQRFDPAAGRGTPLRQIAAQPWAPPGTLEPLVERAVDRLEDQDHLEKDHLRLGAWVEAARLAAGRSDETFFRDPASRRMLEHGRRLTAGDAGARNALSRVRADLEAAGALQWVALQSHLDALRDELAS